MSARIIDGKAVAAGLRAQIAARVAALSFRPGLRVVRVGEDPASGVYVRNKDKAAQEVGFDSATLHLPAATSQALRSRKGTARSCSSGIQAGFQRPWNTVW